MKYMIQIGVIATIAFITEILHFMLPFPIPASVYGMLILFFSLCFGFIKLEQVEDVADWILSVMPIFFIAPTVGLIEAYGDIREQLVPIVLTCFVSTIVVLVVTVGIAQGIIRLRKNRKDGRDVK